jgi:cytidylate kinase
MINVLTIDREYGSGAAAIAHKLADRLGWKLWDQLLTDEIARRLECSRHHVEQREEKKDPLHYRVFKSFMRGSYEGSMNMPRMRMADADGIRQVAEQLVRKAAAEGNAVIVGRGSAFYLNEDPHAFHVFIYAPFEEKVHRLEAEGKSHREAVDLVENVDRDRKAFIKEHFDVDFPHRQFFHLMVNSAIGEDATVQTILDGMAALQKASA